MTEASRGLHGLVSVVGFEEALEAELAGPRRSPAGLARVPRWPGLITVPAPRAAIDPAFALQQLPGIVQVRGDSVSALAVAAEEALGPVLEEAAAPFVLHAYVPDAHAYRSIAGRAALLQTAWLERLRERRRRVAKLLCAEAPATWGEDHLLVQLALVGRSSLLCSAARPRPLSSGGHDLAPWPAGRAPVKEDRQAPSRAYRKLREGLAWLGTAPQAGERVVDLGGAPGGWAHTALALGAAVTAVDRSPLAASVTDHPRLEMILGNAFTYRPPVAVDWLLCDVICEPARTLALVDTWMREGLCRRVVATLKFKGPPDPDILAETRRRLGHHGWPFVRLKHLQHHSNEVVILARR